MKIIIFIIFKSASWILIPEGFISLLVESHISGDGQSAMDSFEFTVIVIRAVFSLLPAIIGVWLYRKASLRQRSEN